MIALQTLIGTWERAGETPLPRSRSHPVYDPKVDEAESEDLWLNVVQRTAPWPVVAAAAIAWDTWLSLNLYPRQSWLGLILAGAILRTRGAKRGISRLII